MTTNVRLTDLPYSLSHEICKHLSGRDFLNICKAVPQWESLLSTQTAVNIARKDIQNWKWMDNNDYALLFPHSYPLRCEALLEAMKYHQSCESAIDAYNHGEEYETFGSICEEILSGVYSDSTQVTLNLRDTVAINDSRIESLHFEINGVEAFSLKGMDFANFQYYKSVFSGRRRGLQDTACIVYFARSSWRLKSEIESLFEDAKPTQTVIIAIVKDEARRARGYRSKFEYLTGFLHDELSGMGDKLLKEKPCKWCLWLIKEQEGSKYSNSMELYKRACYEVLKPLI